MEGIQNTLDMMETIFEEEGIENTTSNQIAFLEGLISEWDDEPLEDDEDEDAKNFYITFVRVHIATLRMKLKLSTLS